ncbi:30S ribosomal protein S18 [Haloferula rosea]|uniref:30S ribosomal protein S18 n=2 Tax=Haloferula rosea TaxID=490093 RepID=A0A934VB39_9BACT|nr:30S ribosomal protein S18 [Haloferula rosea]
MPRRRLDIPVDKVTYTHPEILSKFTSDTGKILPRRVTGVSAKLHRKITREIKRARAVNLMQ